MVNALMQGILDMLGWLLDLVLTPVNLIVDNLFPSVAGLINVFTEFIQNYLGGGISYFAQFIPPITRGVISFWLVFLIAYYGVVWGYTLIIKLWNLIQKLKFW